MIGWLHVAGLALYGVASAVLGVSFARAQPSLARAAGLLLAAGLAVHLWALAEFGARWGELPLVGLGPSLSTLAFLVGLGTLIATTLSQARTLGLVLTPVVTVLTAVASAVGVVPTQETMAFRGVWFVLHVVFAFVGYVGLAVAFAAGLMYLMQFRELKSKHFGAIFRYFPPLDTLDRLGQKGLLVGFPFLTLAVLVAWAWTARFAGAVQPEGSKLLWVILSWFVFVAALAARTGSGRRGQRGALASVIGFVVVVLIYVMLRVGTSHPESFL